MLPFDAFVLSRSLGREVSFGKIIHGDKHTAIAIDTSVLAKEVQTCIERITELLSRPSAPDLALNRHCGECRFQAYCRQKAIARDELSLLRARAAGFTIQLLQDYSAGNLRQVYFHARRENETATVALLQYSDLYQSAKGTSASQHVDAPKSTRGAHVAVDGGTVFYVMGSPVNSVGARSSPSIRKALFDAVAR